MKFSNFQVIKQTAGGYCIPWKERFATVDVTTTTGSLFWKKTKTESKSIYRGYAEMWIFVDSGEHTPGFDVERLERSWDAKKALG